MGRELRAILGPDSLLRSARRVSPSSGVVPLKRGMAVLVWPYDDEADMMESDFDAFLRALSARGPVAHVETSYFGGRGTQRATLWRDGAPALALRDAEVGPVREDGPINQVLAALGVKRCADRDEFDSLGLGWFRTNDDAVDSARSG